MEFNNLDMTPMFNDSECTKCMFGTSKIWPDTITDVLLEQILTGTDKFGYSVAISGTGDSSTVVIGQKDKHVNEDLAGSVVIYTRTGTTWTLEQEIENPNPTYGDAFGSAVAIQGTGNDCTVAIGQNNMYKNNKVYIYKRTGTWTQEEIFICSDIWTGYVALSGTGDDCILVTDAPAITYTRSGTAWSLEHVFSGPSSAQSASVFGSGDNATLILGCPTDDTIAQDAGAAHIYTRSGTWSQEKTYYGTQGDEFGFSVSLYGTGDACTAVIGARYWEHPIEGERCGKCYIYKRTGAWNPEQEIDNPNPAAYDYFGQSVSMHGIGDDCAVLIGAMGDDLNGNNSGLSYIFKRTLEQWSETKEISGAPDYFGCSVSLGEDSCIIGGYVDNQAVIYTL